MHGIAHFTVGFLLAWVVLTVAWRFSPSIRLRLYGPFLPFAVGAFACVPYAASLFGVPTTGAVWNLFILHTALNRSETAGRLLRWFELDTLLVTLAYAHMLSRYISLVRSAGRPHAK